MNNDAYLLGGARTPIGKFLGQFRSVPATTLGATAVRAAIERSQLSPDVVDEVIMGMVVQAGAGQAPARQAALGAGLPGTVAALTVNKVCGSSLKAVMLAAQAIRAGDARVIVAGGMECMSRAPFLLHDHREGSKYGDSRLKDALLEDGLWCPFGDCHMGNHAEYTAEKARLTRNDLDTLALESHRRAVAAREAGRLTAEIVPVDVSTRDGKLSIGLDEIPRADTTLAILGKLKPAFDASGVVTAGNSSPLSDGAAAVVVADAQTAQASPAPWKSRVVAYHTSGGEPRDLFFAPIAAISAVLQKAGLGTNDVDLFEINEAFASQMLACLRGLELDPAKVNVHGGAIALGHPIGASGARVLVTLMSALSQRGLKRGIAALCLGGGNAVAMLIERVETL